MQEMKTVIDKIKEYDTIIIHRHQKPDPDALGSQVGLKELIKENFPDKKVYAVGYDEPSLTYLTTMDQISDDTYKGALVIVCDTANTPRIDDARYSTGDFLIKIDHHPNDDAYGDFLYVDDSASSASEIITEFAMTFGLKLNSESARMLYAGIVGDTGRFLYPATTSRTMYLASILREQDFDFAKLGRQMDSVDLNIAKLQGYVFENIVIDENGAAYVTLSQELLKSYGVTESEVSSVVPTPGRVASIEAWVLFVEQPEGYYRVNLRSKTTVINEIAKNHRGGGHIFASGAVSKNIDENKEIYQELQAAVANK
ncbi:phosphoesterase [Floricoccus penangensis]|uniref:Phosphoesterase n=1 Tax=Floricoccus penangensis TaxID=1859475 RepID=A0A9Q5JGP2_9LACT|nr:bifunctional oligoribonuclease/PAP phosphatase NrnA [Floricoccus penangensis]OFI47082.1 phosphoesterase [Floricoccus penangensis]